MSRTVCDLAIVGGKIATLDAENRFVPALAIRGGRILLAGSNDEIQSTAGEETKVMNLAGQTAIPGIIDRQCHPDSSATGFMYDLGDAYIANRGQEAMRPYVASPQPDRCRCPGAGPL